MDLNAYLKSQGLTKGLFRPRASLSLNAKRSLQVDRVIDHNVCMTRRRRAHRRYTGVFNGSTPTTTPHPRGQAQVQRGVPPFLFAK